MYTNPHVLVSQVWMQFSLLIYSTFYTLIPILQAYTLLHDTRGKRKGRNQWSTPHISSPAHQPRIQSETWQVDPGQTKKETRGTEEKESADEFCWSKDFSDPESTWKSKSKPKAEKKEKGSEKERCNLTWPTYMLTTYMKPTNGYVFRRMGGWMMNGRILLQISGLLTAWSRRSDHGWNFRHVPDTYNTYVYTYIYLYEGG